MLLETEKLRKNLDDIIWRIEQARISVSEHHIVKLVVASKYTSVENIKKLYELGQRAFGENQVQQLKERVVQTEDLPLEWHMIGRLQKNKINTLIDLHPALLHSLDSLELAAALDKRLDAKDKTMNALLQINASAEETKAGVSPQEAVEAYLKIKELYPRIKLKGVMCIGAHSDDQSEVARSFEKTYAVFEKLRKEGAKYCSMGMSGDFELAIKCGSNLVRIGSALLR